MAIVVAIATAAFTFDDSAPQFEATAVLKATATEGTPTVEALEDLISSELVVGRIADELGTSVTAVRNRLSTTSEPFTRLLGITAIADAPEEAEMLAQSAAAELIKLLRGENVITGGIDQEDENELRDQHESLDEKITEVEAALARLDRRTLQRINDPSDAAEIERLALVHRLRKGALIRRLSDLEAQRSSLAPLPDEQAIRDVRLVEVTDARLHNPEGFEPPKSAASQMLLSGLIGIIVGTGVAVIVDRLDSTLRTKGEVEGFLDVPISVEVPESDSHPGPASLTGEANTLFTDPIRLLATGIVARKSSHRRIMVAGTNRNVGTTTIAASLGVALAQAGIRVSLLSMDAESPALHEMLDLPAEPGLAEVFGSQASLNDSLMATAYPGLQAIPIGAASVPSRALWNTPEMGALLNKVNERSDLVLIEAPPLSESVGGGLLSRHVDGVFIVIGANKTTIRSVREATEMLRRVEANLLGAVLNRVT